MFTIDKDKHVAVFEFDEHELLWLISLLQIECNDVEEFQNALKELSALPCNCGFCMECESR